MDTNSQDTITPETTSNTTPKNVSEIDSNSVLEGTDALLTEGRATAMETGSIGEEAGSSLTSSASDGSASDSAFTQEVLPENSADAIQTQNGLSSALEELSSGQVSAEQLNAWVEQIVQLIQIGGPVVWILVGLSILSLSIILLKVWQFALLRPESLKDVHKSLALWQQQQHQAALQTLKIKRPVSSIVQHAMLNLIYSHADCADATQQQISPSQLQDELSRQANGLIHQLRALLRPLDVIAGLSPLLGLMGTVLGMIVAFQQMEAAGSQVDPSVLSGGIWQALLTTAAGLAVAIPVSAAHSWLERKVERVAHSINDAVTQVFTYAPTAHISHDKNPTSARLDSDTGTDTGTNADTDTTAGVKQRAA